MSALVFVLTEVSSIIYFRILSQYDLVKNGSEGTTFKKINEFWIGLGLTCLLYSVLIFAKFFMLNLVVLNSNE